jgi:hypothetical protein
VFNVERHFQNPKHQNPNPKKATDPSSKKHEATKIRSFNRRERREQRMPGILTTDEH